MWLIFSVRPHQDDNSALKPSQANEPLLAIRFPIVLSGEHRLIENTVALRQVDSMLAQIELSLGGGVAHALFIVYALNSWRKRVAEQAVAADRDTTSRARRMCAISFCAYGALDRAARRRSTAAFGDTGVARNNCEAYRSLVDCRFLDLLRFCRCEGGEMSDEPSFWFPVKRYGWGWGLPVRWQGWVVFVAYLVLLYVGIYYFKPQRDVLGMSLYISLLTVALIAIVAIKGERPVGWRWGRR